MCCFARPVSTVEHTTIFARATDQGTQFLVYQMNYRSQDENAMILPVPIRRPASESSLRFIDLEDYSEVFDDLDDGFPYEEPVSIGCSAAIDKSAVGSLAVFKVGNYIASFVPSIEDFSRLDDRFTLPASVWSKVPHYEDFGFAVFQLASGALKPHPMAFEYETDHQPVFFPTLHIHDGEIHEEEEFDHVLYAQHAGFDSRVSSYRNADVPDPQTGLVRSKYRADEFVNVNRTQGIVQGDLLVHRRVIHGLRANQDTEFAASGHPTIPAFNWRPLIAYWPLALGATLLTWFFARRARLRRKRLASDSND